MATAFRGGSLRQRIWAHGGTPEISASHVARFDTLAHTWSALAGSGGDNGVNLGPTLTVKLGHGAGGQDCDLFVVAISSSPITKFHITSALRVPSTRHRHRTDADANSNADANADSHAAASDGAIQRVEL